MTAAPRTTPQPTTIARTHEIERFLLALHGDAEGLIEVGVGKIHRGDPSKIDVFRPKLAWGEGHHFRWYTAETRPQLARDLAHLVQKYPNVYISRTLYTSPERKAAFAQASRVLFFDDVASDPIFSMLVETSPGNYQGYIFTTEAMDATTVRELSERGAKALRGTKSEHADTCYDVTRLVRIPSTYNTKNGARFPVRIASHTSTTYSVAELRNRWPEVERLATVPADLAWPEVEHCLAMIDGITKRIKTTSPTYRQLHSNGGDDRSDLRWGLACNLRTKFGYPDEEIAAILWHFNWGHLQEKGTDWLKGDIEDCIAGANSLYPNVQTKPSYCRLAYHQVKPAQPIPQVERRRRGRQTRWTDDQYLEALRRDADSGRVLASQAELAARYGVGVATIRRIEKRLQAAGNVERHTVRKRGGTYSYITLFSAITNTPQIDIKDTEGANLVLSQDVPEAQPHAETRETATVVESTHPPDRAMPEVQPSPSEAVSWAFTVLRANEQIVTLKRVRDWIADNVPGADWPERQIKSAYNVHRKHEEREYSAGYWEGLHSMTVAELQRAIESVDHRLHNPSKRPRLTPAQLRTRRGHLRTVLDQKIAEAKRAPAQSGACVLPQQLPKLEPSYIDGVRIMALHGNQAVRDYLNAKQISPAQHGAYVAAAKEEICHARAH